MKSEFGNVAQREGLAQLMSEKWGSAVESGQRFFDTGIIVVENGKIDPRLAQIGAYINPGDGNKAQARVLSLKLNKLANLFV